MNQRTTNAGAARHNREAWDQLAKHQQRFTRAAKDEEFRDPLSILDGNGWLGGNINGKNLLCLAAGGGRQAPLYAAAGARVTAVDVSPDQLELDREVAAERGLDIRTVETSMDQLNMFQQAEFDVVIHPVSSCYIPELKPVYQQVARVTAPGGLYISQHKQPGSLQATVKPQENGYLLEEPYYREGPLPAVVGSLHREEGTLEFLHRWEQLLGEMCRAGFVIEDLTEPCHAQAESATGTFGHRSVYVAPYIRIKARRQLTTLSPAHVWTPT